MSDYLHEYMLINNLVQELGFERALLLICMNIVHYLRADEINNKQNRIKCWINYFLCNRKVHSIKKCISSGRMSGNCIAIALYSFYDLRVHGCISEIVNEVCLIDGKVEAHMCVKCGKYVINRNTRQNASTIRKIRLENVINEWIERVCQQHVANNK